MDGDSKSIQHADAMPVAEMTEQIDRAELNQRARQADEADHQERILTALGLHYKAIFWAFMVSMCVIMEGYDTNLLGNFYAFPAFAKKFGKFDEGSGKYQLTAPWQAGLGNSSGVGAFFGALLNGFLVDRFGHKRVVLGSLVALTAFLFIVFFANKIEVLLVGEIFCGFPWGIFATIAPAYASEILPLSLRVYMTSWTNMCFIIGQLISAGVMAGLVDNNTQWAYKIPFAIQWVWPVILVPILSFAPQSPWYLVRKGCLEEARHSLVRLNHKSTDAEAIDAQLALIIHTDNQEKELLLEGKTSYLQCFIGVEARRTEIACMVFAGTILTGLCFAYNTTYFFSSIGLSPNQTYNLNVGGTGMALGATLISWVFIMPYFGRRTIYLWGTLGMTVILFLIGILNIRTDKHSFALAQAVLTLVWTFVFQLSVGQMAWALPAEIGSTRLRQKTVVIGRNAYYIVSVIATVLEPYFINPTAWNLKGYTSFFWMGTSLITLVWVFFRLPETKGRSYEEINLLFAKRIGSRDFSKYQVDAFEESDEKGGVIQVENVRRVR
ncbi:general substrate transporter [Xylogone sp. PMI_703]|nr:general substrate transporter [Xylogone sp. PMI_703]